MRGIMESAFCIAYLIVVITLGIMILRGYARLNAGGAKKQGGLAQFRVFGIMTLILGAGDSFHLVPRIMGMLGPGLEAYTAALGIGTLVTSIGMTVFYVMLYHVWRIRYGVQGNSGLTAVIYGLAVIRAALCFFPQNRWTDADAPVSWGIYRNIPFVVLGVVLILLYYRMATARKDAAFRFMWLAAALSFAFYIPVVLWADANPLVGMLMLPKTCAYVWMVWMGYSDAKRKGKA